MGSCPAGGSCFCFLVVEGHHQDKIRASSISSVHSSFVDSEWSMFEFGGVGLLVLTSRLSRAEKMETHVLGSRVQNHFFFSDEVERWSGVGHAHGARNQCTSDEFWSTSSVRQVPWFPLFSKKGLFCFCTVCGAWFPKGALFRQAIGYSISCLFVLSCGALGIWVGWLPCSCT